jgi:hypothetical protein
MHIVGTATHNYDHQAIDDFIDLVFHTPPTPDAHRLVYTARTNIPRMPVTVADMHKSLRHNKARSMYFNTSTCVPDQQGTLRHKKSLFSAFHVLVLDDIGTKIPTENVPTDMKPTYIIETSQGNFQYGYVLDEPLTDLNAATALCQTAALSGLTDGGGVMATKIVRLPEGVNGKAGPKQDFQVTLIDDEGPFWTPELLVERMRCTVDGEAITWEGILQGDTPLAKKYHNRNPIHSQSAEGVIDPVLEWFYENDLVMGDGGGDWIDIECPWHLKHSSGNNTAGYAPVGRGDMSHIRGFKCFHDHCKDRTIIDLIQWVLASSDFNHLAVEEARLNATEFAFDPAQDMVWNIPEGRAWKISGFRTMHNTPLWAYEPRRDKPRKITAAESWLLSHYRTVVAGAYHSPGSPPLFEKGGSLWVNPYRGPAWSDGQYDMKHVQPFLDFLEYLLPDADERAYFIQWLSAKAQNPRFRGTGIIMQTQAFGTGRGTLAAMVNQIWQDKTAGVEFDTLIRSEGFNGWEAFPLVIVGEARESTSKIESKGAHKAYETLKQRMDTSVVRGKINEKFQPEKQIDICSSYLLFTNHINAVAVPQEDRRITVLSNPMTAESPQYFVDVYRWLDAGKFPNNLAEHDQWAWHVWHWLLEQDTDTAKLALPLRTSAKQLMTDSAQTPMERACSCMALYMVDNDISAISPGTYKTIVTQALQKFDPNLNISTSYMLQTMNDSTTALAIKLHNSTSGKSERVRVNNQVLRECKLVIPDNAKLRTVPASKFKRATKNRFATDMARLNMNTVIDFIVDQMQ